MRKLVDLFSRFEVVNDVKQVIAFMKKTGVQFKFFAITIFFSLGLTLFNMYTVVLLFPLVQGIIKSDFSGVKSMQLVGSVVKMYPHFFNTSIRLFVLLVMWVYLNIILKNLLSYAASISTEYQAKEATIKLRNILMDRCLSFGKSFYDKNKIPHLHGTLTRSTNVIANQFNLLKDLIIQLFLFVMFLGTMLNISWPLTLVSFIAFPIVNSLTKKAINKIRDSLKESEAASADLNDRVLNILNCVPLVKAFVKEEDEKALFSLVNEGELNTSFKAKKLSSMLAPVEDIGSTTSTLFLAFGMALVIHLTGALDPSKAFVFFYLAQRIIPILNSFNSFKLGMVRSKKDVEEVNNLLDENQEHLIMGGEKEFEGLQHAIEIKDLTFYYHEAENPAVANLNFSIPKGKMTAIVGPTGSGKSTILNLLLRFYNVPVGSLFIDGVDVTNFKPESLRKKMSFVGQESLLFNDSVRNNLIYGVKEIDDNKIVEIAQKVAVHDFIDRLPDKYNTIVRERGSNFSGGEKQRMAIARALLRDAEILILDEATSALDAATEEKVVRAIEEVFPDKTLIVISHRLSTIKNADNVIFVEQGHIKEKGSLEELLALQGSFYQHWQAQKI